MIGKRTNVILADDLGFGDLSAWGGRDLRTPNIDALAGFGSSLRPVLFELACATADARCAVNGLLSGHGRCTWGDSYSAREQLGYLAAKAQLLPARLREAGYHSALVGKWHLGLEAPNLPNQRGFDHFHISAT